MSKPAPEEPKEGSNVKKGKRYKGRACMRTGWRQDELPKIIRGICKKYPGITYIEVNKDVINWNFEVHKDEIVKRKYPINNPSKR